MKYIELIITVLIGSGGFYLLLEFLVNHIRERTLVKSLKLEALIDWAAVFAVRAAENYGRVKGLNGLDKYLVAVDMAREKLLSCGLETDEVKLKQSIGSAYEKLRPVIKRSGEK